MFLSLEKFCTCTQTYQRHSLDIDPYPWEPESHQAIARLFENIIDPIIDYFGKDNFQLTYGFCSVDLKKYLEKGRNQTCCKVDQHCAHELNRNGNPICSRPGAAADFYIADIASSRLVKWIIDFIPFDSLYYYGDDRPVHVSYGSQHKRAGWDMQKGYPRKLRI